MIDYTDAKSAMELVNSLIDDAKRYKYARKMAQKAKYDLDIVLASMMENLSRKRSNFGIQSGYLMLIEIAPELKHVYDDILKYEAEYKGLEKIISAKETKISLIQSLIKNKINEGG